MIFKPKSIDLSTLYPESCNHSLPVSDLGPRASGAAGEDNEEELWPLLQTSVPGLAPQRQTHHYHEHTEKSVFHGQVLIQTVTSPGSPGYFLHSAPSMALLGGGDAGKAVSGSSGEKEQGPATPCLTCSSQSPSRRRPRVGRGSRASSSLNRDVS